MIGEEAGMSHIDKLYKIVEKKPMILIRFDEELSESLINSKQGFDHLTIVRPHSVLQDLKVPTLCLLEIKESQKSECYLGVVTRKMAVSTFDFRLTIKSLSRVTPSSLKMFQKKITVPQMKAFLKKRIPDDGGFSVLSPKISVNIVGVLAKDAKNGDALNNASLVLRAPRDVSNVNWAQNDAIRTAIGAFGIKSSAIPEEIVLKNNSVSELGLLVGAHLYEDNVVYADASDLPGFDKIAVDLTGRAIFEKREERLVVYTANKLPLENMLGVDLIYINETRGNIVMVQYKMLEESNEGKDWVYRPDRQLKDEIARMNIPDFQGKTADYRLNSSPFYFKFVKRKIVDDSHQSFIVSLEHLTHLLASPDSKGPKGGVLLSYDKLDGTYLREADLIGLIRSGYIGTHRAETESLAIIIDGVSRGDRALVLAWQQRVSGE